VINTDFERGFIKGRESVVLRGLMEQAGSMAAAKAAGNRCAWRASDSRWPDGDVSEFASTCSRSATPGRARAPPPSLSGELELVVESVYPVRSAVRGSRRAGRAKQSEADLQGLASCRRAFTLAHVVLERSDTP